jgi:hypothetical protein
MPVPKAATRWAMIANGSGAACGYEKKPGGQVRKTGLTGRWYCGTLVPLYQGDTVPQEQKNREPVVVERVQTGVRIEKRLLKVLKAVAELKEISLGDLLEGIVLHVFEGKPVPFSPQTLKEIEQFKAIYGMTLKSTDSHNLKERKR